MSTLCEALKGHKGESGCGGCQSRCQPAVGPPLRAPLERSHAVRPSSHLHLPSKPTELKAVDFGNNNMGKEGAAALAGLLRESPAITDVNINMNDVGDDGAFQARSCTVL